MPVPAEAPFLDPADDASHLGSPDSVRFWTLEQRIVGFRNMDKVFPTRIIRAGGSPLELPEQMVDLGEVQITCEDSVLTTNEYLVRQNVAGLLAIKNDRIVYERYGLGNTRDTKWNSFSVAKSVTSMLMGAAIRDGHIGSVDERVTDYLPRLKGSSYDQASIRNLLQMASGVEANTAMSEANKELFQANVALSREGAVERIRGEVQSLERATDFEAVLSVLSGDLKAAGIPFDTCSIDVLDEPVERPAMATFEDRGFRYTAYTIDPDGAVTSRPHHIPAPFPSIVLETIERFIAGQPWRARTDRNAIVEVPISSYGRLRLAASDRREFAEADVDALRDFASAIALGYARYLDIREIQEQTERKSAFLASMSHELRTPMNAIIGFTRMVLRRAGDALPDRQKDNLHKVMQSANNLLAMINDLLDLSKIEAGRMDVSAETFDVKVLVTACCATVGPLVAEKPDVNLTWEVPDDIGEAHTDQGRLRQILMNLLSNAIKFTNRGEVTVRVSKVDEDLVIAVSDTGAGIPADALETIFEEFRQVEGSDPQHKGTGLGLPICKGFAELLGGSIGVRSEEGRGSTFTVRIPMMYGEN